MSLSIQTGIVSDFLTGRDEWYSVDFPFAFAGDAQVVVSAQIQTRGGEDTPALRLKNVSSTGFEVRMDELIGNDVTSSTVGDLGKVVTSGEHPNAETLGWIAIAT